MSPRTRSSGQRRRRAAAAATEPVRLVPREGATEGAALPSSERVYRSLRDQILTGALAPLTRLVELHVAQQFSVSRTPVQP